MGNGIIACIIFFAFFRAAGEYSKNGFAWGAIGIASFFIPSLVLPMLAAFVLTLMGASGDAVVGSFTIGGLIGFGAGVLAVVWMYNKLMERAIDQQAALDAQTSAQRLSSQPQQDA